MWISKVSDFWLLRPEWIRTHADIYVKTSFSLSTGSLSHFLELFWHLQTSNVISCRSIEVLSAEACWILMNSNAGSWSEGLLGKMLVCMVSPRRSDKHGHAAASHAVKVTFRLPVSAVLYCLYHLHTESCQSKGCSWGQWRILRDAGRRWGPPEQKPI